MRVSTDNIQKAGSYERLAAHTQVANERRRGLSELVRRVQNARLFEQVLTEISRQSA
jgi:sulfur transfer protein SufE